MPIGTKIRTGALWMFMGKSGSQILSFAFGVVLARLLAPDVFGMLLTIQVFTGVASFIAGGGMGQALVRAKDTTRADYDVVFTLQLAIGCAIYTMFFAVAPLIASAYDKPLYADMIRVMALSFIFRPFTNVPASILQREMRFKGMTLVGIASLIVSSTTSIVLAYHGFGVWSLILGGFASPLVTIPAYGILAKWRPGVSWRFGRAREIARYGLWVSVTDIIVYMRGRASALVMSFTLGPTAIGLYNKGESLAEMPNNFVTGSVYQVLFRALSAEQQNLDKCRYLFFRGISLVAVYVAPFYVGLIWIAEPLIRGMYGPSWVDAAVPLSILAFAWPFWLVDMLSGAVLAAFAWLRREVVVQSMMLIVTCVTIFLGLPYGIAGIAVAILITAGFGATYMYLLATRCLKAARLNIILALTPAFLLCSILAAVLYLTDSFLPSIIHNNDLLYVFSMVAIGSSSYILSFLLMPLSTLKTEQDRLKKNISHLTKAFHA
jgi:teichuronic acid exporter